MTGSDIGTWIGTFFSLVGAGIAIWQAKVAKSASKKATEMRDEIKGRHRHGQLSEIDVALQAACKAMDKYGPGSSINALSGTLPDSDANAVRGFTAALDRNSAMLEETFGESLVPVRDQINRLLIDFANCANDGQRLKKGLLVYNQISMFSGNMRKALDRRVYDPPALT